MVLSIKHPEADRLARELARRTGESITEAVVNSLRERLRREEGRLRNRDLVKDLEGMAIRCSRLPVLDRRTPGEILGYDQNGLPR
ncbi:MAG TPA: type II toxin-antitoxin system VapB family antitoxin [Vicinamibacteria bacterium]|nr:type II toxin-antitoxin system VapB family antitoxin [Vicinamibacteria bacterium]